MDNEIKKFLEFNGKAIYFRAVDGVYWVAIKPICEVLNVDYIRQFKNLKEDKILAQLLSDQTIVAADNRKRKMLCLPEKYVYGWLFSINSNSPELLEYKKAVYDILYDYFKGTITRRQQLLADMRAVKEEQKRIEEEIKDEKYRRLKENKEKIRHINQSLKKLDADLLNGQMQINI